MHVTWETTMRGHHVQREYHDAPTKKVTIGWFKLGRMVKIRELRDELAVLPRGRFSNVNRSKIMSWLLERPRDGATSPSRSFWIWPSDRIWINLIMFMIWTQRTRNIHVPSFGPFFLSFVFGLCSMAQKALRSGQEKTWRRPFFSPLITNNSCDFNKKLSFIIDQKSSPIYVSRRFHKHNFGQLKTGNGCATIDIPETGSLKDFCSYLQRRRMIKSVPGLRNTLHI